MQQQNPVPQEQGNFSATHAHESIRLKSFPSPPQRIDQLVQLIEERLHLRLLVNALFASTGIPLLRIHVREIEQVERMVEKLTKGWLQRWAVLENR